MPSPIIRAHTLLVFIALCAVVSAAGCATHGPYITHATIEWPGASPRQMDEVIARPAGQRLFRDTGGVREVVSISIAGKVDLYATSDGIVKQPDFVQAMSDSLADLAGTLPRGAVAGAINLAPQGKPVPQPPVRQIDEIGFDIDRAKLIDAGLSQDDIARAIARAREDAASRAPAGVTTTAPAAQLTIETMNATTLPSHGKPLTLGDVAFIHVVTEPDTIERHWP